MVKFKFYFIATIIILSNIIRCCYSQETHTGIGSIPSLFTWFLCSRYETNYIGYDVQLVNTTQLPDGRFGQVVLGQQRKFDTYGMVTIVSNFTNMQLYIDPSGPALNFYKAVSCFDAPVQRCRQELKTLLLTKETLCLGITNPTSVETKFTLSISFTSGVPIPALNIPPVSGTITPSTTGPSIVTTIEPTNIPSPQPKSSSSSSTRTIVEPTAAPFFYVSEATSKDFYYWKLIPFCLLLLLGLFGVNWD